MFGTNPSLRSCSRSEDRAVRRAMMPMLKDWHQSTTVARCSGGIHSRKTRGDAESVHVKLSDTVVHNAVGGASSILGPTTVSSSREAMILCR
eukprot:3066288-Rhodomonas_salina.1